MGTMTRTAIAIYLSTGMGIVAAACSGGGSGGNQNACACGSGTGCMALGDVFPSVNGCCRCIGPPLYYECSGGFCPKDGGQDAPDGSSYCDSNGWCEYGGPTAGAWSGVWAGSPTDAWAVGSVTSPTSDAATGAMWHWDGSSWKSMTYSAVMSAVWGSGPNDVWAVGSGGNIAHWTGSAWNPVAGGTTGNLGGVWGASATDVWTVGWAEVANAAPVILHWDGSSWTP